MTNAQINALKELDEWFKLQQELSLRVSKSLNLLSRDKYLNKPMNYTLDGDIKCEISEKDALRICGENSSVHRNLECTAAFQSTIDFLEGVANSRIRLSKALSDANL